MLESPFYRKKNLSLAQKLTEIEYCQAQLQQQLQLQLKLRLVLISFYPTTHPPGLAVELQL